MENKSELPVEVVTQINEQADKFGFVVPYDGSNKFYNDDKVEGYKAGATAYAAKLIECDRANSALEEKVRGLEEGYNELKTSHRLMSKAYADALIERDAAKAQQGTRWVRASEYDHSKGGVLFYRFLGPTLKSCGTGNFSGGKFHGLIGDHFSKDEWQYLYILDESTPAGREEDAVAFHDWVEKYRSEYDFREQRTHTTAELYKLFKQQKESK